MVMLLFVHLHYFFYSEVCKSY